MDALNRLLGQMRAYWAGLNAGRRIGIVVGTLGVLLALAAVVYFAPGARYAPLDAGTLPPEEVAAMRTRLNTDNIPNRLTGGGTGLEVPEERLAEARVALAAAGIPARGGRGYELFDETSLMTTPFVQSVNYQRALQAELARSVMQMEAVQSARVIVARPEPSPFVREQRPTTASVVIKLKPRAGFSPATASAIVSLVAHSVEGLRPENVTVMETGGRLLSDPHAGGRGDMPTPQLEYLQRLETYLSTKAEEVLSKTLGAGRAVVRVSADVNFQKIKERVKTYTPDGKVIQAEMLQNSSSTSARSGGVAGARSNIAVAGGPTPPLAGGSGGTSKDETERRDYALNETIREIEGGGDGLVTRLSVAALVDLSPQGEGKAVIGQAAVEELIRQAIGVRAGRDSVTVAQAALSGPEAAAPDDTLVRLQRFQTYISLARNLSVAVAVVLTLLVLGLLLLRIRPAAPAGTAAPAVAGAAAPGGPAKPGGPTPPPTPDERRAAVLARFQTLARSEPNNVANVLNVMLGEQAA